MSPSGMVETPHLQAKLSCGEHLPVGAEEPLVAGDAFVLSKIHRNILSFRLATASRIVRAEETNDRSDFQI